MHIICCSLLLYTILFIDKYPFINTTPYYKVLVLTVMNQPLLYTEILRNF